MAKQIVTDEDQECVPVDKGWAWMVSLAFFVNCFCMVGLIKSFGIVIQEFVIYFNVPLYQGVMVMAVMSLAFTLLSPVMIGLGERFTHRWVVMAAALVGFAGIALGCFLVNITFIIIVLGVMLGIGNSGIFPVGLVMISKYFKRHLALASGLSLSGASIGVLGMPPIIQYLLEKYGLKGTLLLMSGIYLQNLVCGALYRPPSFYYCKKNKLEAKSEIVALTNDYSYVDQEVNSFLPQDSNKDPDSMSTVHDIFVYDMASTGSFILRPSLNSIDHNLNGKESHASIENVCCCPCSKSCPILKNPIVLFFDLFNFLVFFGYFNFILFMPGDAISRGITAYEKAFLVSFAGIGDLVGRLAMAVLGDRLVVARYKFMAACCALNGVNVVIYTFANKYWWLAIHSTIYGVCGGCFVALNSVVLIDFVGVNILPRALSTVMVVQGAAISAGQPILGLLKDLTGEYTLSNILMGTSMLLGGIVLFFYPLVRKFGQVEDDGENKFPVPEECIPLGVSKNDDKSA